MSSGDRYTAYQVARKLGHDPGWVFSPSRHRKHVQARRDVARALRECGWSYPRIGNAIGRNHASVLILLGAGKRGRAREERLAQKAVAR